MSDEPKKWTIAVGLGSGKTSLMLLDAFKSARRGDIVLVQCADGNDIHIMPAKEYIALKAKYDAMAGGLCIKGWWCICDIFNGEEKEPRNECRSCGKPKTVRAPRD